MNLFTSGTVADIFHKVGMQLLETFAFGFLGQTVFLFVALWIMIKLQKLNCNPFALLGSAALACALDNIPYVGWEISAVALLLCITKAIGARTFTDAIFTTGISYALMFCFNLFVLSVLLGDLRHGHGLQVRARTPESPEAVENGPATNSPANTNVLVVTSSEPAKPPAAKTPAPAPLVYQGAGEANAPAAPKADTATAGKMASEVATHFAIRGISKGAIQTIAMISNGTRSYDVVAGDTFQLPTASGKANVVCDSVDENKVVLEVEGVRVTISHKPAGR